MTVDNDFLSQASDLMDIPPDTTLVDDGGSINDTPADSGGDITSANTSTTVENPDTPDTSPQTITEPTSVETPVDVLPEVDERDAIIEQMRKQIAELSGSGEVWPTQQAPTKDPITTPQPDQKVETKQVISPQDALAGLLQEVPFLSDDELDAVIDDPKLINKAINKARQDMAQTVFGVLPEIVGQMVQQQMLVHRVVQSFYEQNEDLRPYGDFVRFKMSQIEKANPTLTYQDIFTQTAEECRKGLGLKNPKAKERDKPAESKPAFTQGKKSSTQRPSDSKPEIFDENARDLLTLI